MFFQRQQKRLRAQLNFFRHRIPYWLIWRVLRLQNRALEWRARFSPVGYRSRNDNIYYAATIKSGSQWLSALFSDFDVQRYSGLPFYDHLVRMYAGREPRPRMTERRYERAFPVKRFIGTLYLDYNCFQTIPKPENWRAFFVMRDPRDLLVSWYYSAKISHIIIGKDTIETRQKLLSLSVEDGLIYGIDWFRDYGLFQSLESWYTCNDERVRVVRYEDLVSERQETVFAELFEFLDIRMPEDRFRELLEAYSFRKLSGRDPGMTDENSHIRKGKAGDWRQHFTPKVQAHWERVVGDLPVRLGYK